MAEQELSIVNITLQSMGGYDEAFSNDVLVFINNALMELAQNKIIDDHFVEATKETTYEDISIRITNKGGVKSYIEMYVKFYFDSPAPSMVPKYESLLKDTLYRLMLSAELQKH